MATKRQKQEAKAKKIFFIVLFTWIAAIPAAILFQIIFRLLFGGVDVIVAFINAISALMVLYGLFGWIPLVASAFYWESKK